MKKSILLIAAILLIGHFQSKATHAAGGYINYQWLSGNTYQVTVTFYRDCLGIAAPQEMEIDLNSSCYPFSIYGYGALAPRIAPINGTEIGYACAGATTCSGGSSPGYIKYVYQTTIDLTGLTCTDWTLSFKPSVADNQVLGRNNNINTIEPTCEDPTTFAAAQCNLFTQTTLDNVDHPTNSSVNFINDPVVFICAGQKAIFNLGATDANGVDSLNYQLVTAQGNNGDGTSFPLTYYSPLSGLNPLYPGAGAVTINSKTGDITINTSTTQFGVMDVQVLEYKGGIVIGSVIIEAQVIVQPCAANNYPTISGINNTSQYADTVCPGNTVSFTVYSNDADVGQIVTMKWDNGIPSPASFTISGTPHPTGTFTWKTSPSDARPQPYTFTVTVNDNNCPTNGFQTHAYSIYVLGPSVSISPSNPSICSGQSITLNALGATTYVWSTQETTSSINVSTGQTYSVTGTSSGCSATATTTVTVNPLPTITITPADPISICQGQSVTLTANGGTTYVWSTNATTTSITVSTAQTYTVTGTKSGCSNTATKQVTVNQGITVAIIPPGPTSICQGQSVTLTATGATTYLWSTQATTSSITVSTDQTYSVTGTSNSCTGKDSRHVTVNQNPTVAITPASPVNICQGQTVTLTATGATTYLWSTQETTSSIIVSTDQTYSVTGTTGTCNGSDSRHVTVNQNPTVTITPGDPVNICQGQSVTLTANGASTYIWSTEETTSSITVSTDQTYSVTGTTGGCTGSDSRHVTVIPNPTVTISPANPVSICQGQSVTLTVTGADTYLWSTQETTSSITVSTDQTYSVTGTTGSCSGSDSRQVIVNPNPTVTIFPKDTSICEGEGVQLCANPGTSPFFKHKLITGRAFFTSMYSWTVNSRAIPDDGQCINAMDPGSYVVTYTDANGCSAVSDPVVVKVSLPPTVVVTPSGTIEFCKGDNVILTAATAARYVWSDDETTSSITVTSNGQFFVTGYNIDGCSVVSNTVTVIVDDLPTVTVTPNGNIAFCQGDSVTLIATGSDTYLWSPGNETTSSITVKGNGTYFAVGTNSTTSCQGISNSVEVTVNANPNVNAGADTSVGCNSPAVQLNGSSTTAGVTFSWTTSGDGTIVSGANTATPTVDSAGTYTLTVTDPSSGCTATDVVLVTLKQAANCTISGNGFICASSCAKYSGCCQACYDNHCTKNGCGKTAGCCRTSSGNHCGSNCCSGNSGGSTQLCGPEGNVSYVWSTGETTSCITVHEAKTYSLTVTNSNGCPSTCSKTVIIDTPPCDITGNTKICQGDYTDLCGPDGDSLQYSWSNGKHTKCIKVTCSGTYELTVTNANGCSSTCSVCVTVENPPSCCISGDLKIKKGQCTSLCAPAGCSTYLWSTGETTRCITVKCEGNYCVTVTNSIGCSSTCCVCVVYSNNGCGRLMSSSDDGSDAMNSYGNLDASAYPNPFTNIATIAFRKTDETSHVLVEVYSLNGEKVATLFDSDAIVDETYNLMFDGTKLSGGIYMYRITYDGQVTNGKLMLMK